MSKAKKPIRVSHPELVKALKERRWRHEDAADFLGMDIRFFRAILYGTKVQPELNHNQERKLFELTRKTTDELFPKKAPGLSLKSMSTDDLAAAGVRCRCDETEADQVESLVAAHQVLMSCLERLTERQAEAVRLRFGIDDGTLRTYEQVGELLGIKHQAVSQLVAKAKKRMQKHLLADS